MSYTLTILWHFNACLTSFLIGVYLNQADKDSVDPLMTARKDQLRQTIEKIKNLKDGLSPMMFVMFVTKCILIINNVLSIACAPWAIEGGKDQIMIYFAVEMASYVLDLLYVTLIVEDTTKHFKEEAISLRYYKQGAFKSSDIYSLSKR